MKKYVNILFITFLLIISIIEFLKIKNQEYAIQLLIDKSAHLKHESSILKNNIIDSWQYERSTLNMDNIYDENEQKLSNDFWSSESPILIFRFSKIDCSQCVIEQIELINRVISNNHINCIIISDYSNKRQLGIFKRTNEIKDIVYNSETLLHNETRTPYFCVYDNGIVSHIFFPDNDFPDLTKAYLKKVLQKYFKI
jgi:hypothetical protein